MFKKNKISYFFILFSFVFGFLGMVNYLQKAEAASVSAGVLDISYDTAPGPLFSATNIAPGYNETRNLIVTNTGSVPHSFSIAVFGDLGYLANVLTIEPKIFGATVWSKTIAEIAKNPQSSIIITSIAPGGSADVDLTAKLATSVGNDFQGESTLAFSFIMGNESTDQIESPSIHSPPPIISFAENSIAGPTLRSHGSNNNSVAAAAENQNISGTSDENQNKNSVVDQGSAKGVETESETLCFWWLIILLVLIGFLYFYNRLGKSRKILFFWFWPLLVAVGLYFLQNYFDQFYQETLICRYFWLLEIVILTIYYLLEFHPRFKKEKS